MGSGTSSVINRDKQYRLVSCIEQKNEKLFKDIVNHEGIKVNFIVYPYGQALTPIHYAAIYDCPEIIKFLFRRVNLNVCDNYGWTPLHHCAFRNNLRSYETLVRLGAKQFLKTKENYPGKYHTKNKTALELSNLQRNYNVMNTSHLINVPIHVTKNSLSYSQIPEAKLVPS